MSERKAAPTGRDSVGVYLDEIGRHPLISKDDEIALARDIEAGREAATDLSCGDTLCPSRQQALQRAVRRGEYATERFIVSNLRLVVSIARKYQGPDAPLLDLIQDGNLGLIHAVEKFDWRRGFKFSTYATWWIRQAISRGLESSSRTIRLPSHIGDQLRQLLWSRDQLRQDFEREPTLGELAAETGLSVDKVLVLLAHVNGPISLDEAVGESGNETLVDIVADSGEPGPESTFDDRLVASEVDRALALLDDTERNVLRLRWGLDGGRPLGFVEVGAQMGISGDRASRIERSAFAKLRHPSARIDSRALLAG